MRYNPCPRFPEGTKWEVAMRSHYGSCAWNMESFEDAIAYLRDQYRKQEDRWLCDFWGFVDGPGGRMDWQTIRPLVERR